MFYKDLQATGPANTSELFNAFFSSTFLSCCSSNIHANSPTVMLSLALDFLEVAVYNILELKVRILKKN